MRAKQHEILTQTLIPLQHAAEQELRLEKYTLNIIIKKMEDALRTP